MTGIDRIFVDGSESLWLFDTKKEISFAISWFLSKELGSKGLSVDIFKTHTT